MRIAVVGGGISGLTVAYLARAAGHEVTCIDAGAVPGGLIHSERVDGFLCEAGPQAVLSGTPDTTALLGALDLNVRALAAAPEAKRRFIFAHGALHPVPMSPPALLRSKLLSASGKLRVLGEPFVRRGKPQQDEAGIDSDSETVAAFGARRLGRAAARTLVGTAVIGIYAADAETLSLASAFPRLAAMEREHGGLLRGMLAARRAGRRPGQPTSFPDGLGELPAALARALGPAALSRGTVTGIERRPGADPGWRLHIRRSASDAGAALTAEVDAVVLTVGGDAAADLLRPLAPPAATALTGMLVAPVAVCCLGFRDVTPTDMGMDLAAYGFLVARGEGPRLLGCQYESSTFAGRAPPGGVLLRAILGGYGQGFDPDIVDASDEEIARRACTDLATVAGLRRAPDLVRVWRYPRGIPLYAPGHAARVAAVDAALAAHPRLFVIGHGLRGVGVNESIRAATTLVREQFAPGARAAASRP